MTFEEILQQYVEHNVFSIHTAKNLSHRLEWINILKMSKTDMDRLYVIRDSLNHSIESTIKDEHIEQLKELYVLARNNQEKLLIDDLETILRNCLRDLENAPGAKICNKFSTLFGLPHDDEWFTQIKALVNILEPLMIKRISIDPEKHDPTHKPSIDAIKDFLKKVK